jgi:hypothetical protein
MEEKELFDNLKKHAELRKKSNSELIVTEEKKTI